MGETTYITKGLKRRTQIYAWLNRIIDTQYPREKQIILLKLISEKNFNESLSDFYNLIIKPIISENPENIGYIIAKNISRFGTDTIVFDLFKNTFSLSKNILKKQKNIKKLKGVKLKEIIKEKKDTPKIIYGLDKNNKRKKANVSVIFKNKKPVIVLRDNKGKFLKQTKSFKKRKQGDNIANK